MNQLELYEAHTPFMFCTALFHALWMYIRVLVALMHDVIIVGASGHNYTEYMLTMFDKQKLCLHALIILCSKGL